MTPALFSKIGEALYGPSWRARLGEALTVSERTIRRWQDGTVSIPDGVRFDLADLCRKHSAELAKLADQLDRR